MLDKGLDAKGVCGCSNRQRRVSDVKKFEQHPAKPAYDKETGDRNQPLVLSPKRPVSQYKGAEAGTGHRVVQRRSCDLGEPSQTSDCCHHGLRRIPRRTSGARRTLEAFARFHQADRPTSLYRSFDVHWPPVPIPTLHPRGPNAVILAPSIQGSLWRACLYRQHPRPSSRPLFSFRVET